MYAFIVYILVTNNHHTFFNQSVNNFITSINGNGTLYYSIDNGTTWQTVSGLSISNALLLDTNSRVYFKPNANWNGAIDNAFLYLAWDKTNAATAGSKVVISGTGGSTAYSLDVGKVGITVSAINDAPTGTSKTITLVEDGSKTFAASDFGFADASDTPANALQAVIITTLPSAGTLKLNGASVTANQSIAVADLDKLVYAPAANGNGTGYTTIDFKVQDNGGTANGGADTSATANTLTFNVTAVNDQPTTPANTVSTSTEDQGAPTNATFGQTIGSLASLSGRDVEGAAVGLAFVAPITNANTWGKAWYSIDGGTTFTTATGNSFVLANATYGIGKVVIKQADIAGNVSATTASTVEYVVNDNLPTFDVIATDGIINAEERTAGVVLTGDVKPGTKSVTIKIDDGVAKTAIVDAAGNWSYDLLTAEIPANATDLTFTVQATDADGILGPVDSTDVIVDLTATTPTFNIIAEDGVISYEEKIAGVTITGTTEVGSTVAISIDGGTEALATVVDGVWNYKLPEAQVKDGTIKITATATDKAGNESVSVDQSVNVLGQIIDINAANTTPYDASTGNFNFYVASGDYTYTINGFGAGDKIDFPAGNAPTVKNDNTTDNAVDLQYANDGKITVLHLTGLTAAQDSTIYSVNSFNTTFGANSVTSTGSSSTPAPVVTNQAVSATGTASASAGNIVFNFAAGSYTYSVSDFASGDGLNFPTDVAPTVINTDVTDKKVDVQWASSGKVISVSVTGLTDAQDGALYSANSFKTLFGANSLTNTGEPPVTPAGNTLSVFAAGSANAGASNVKFAFAAGNYNYTISGYSNGDVLDFPDDVAATVRNTSTTDNSIDVQWASGGNVVVVTLTGLATDTAYSVNSFNAAFGTGSII